MFVNGISPSGKKKINITCVIELLKISSATDGD